jgi:hypothetical protein
MLLEYMIAEVVSGSIGYFVEKGWDKILSKDDYEEEMNHIVYSTIEEYKQERPLVTDQFHFPFYDSQNIINGLFRIGIGERSDRAEAIILQELNTNPNIKQPQPSDIKLFLDIFYSKCNNNAKIQQLNIEKHYKQEIFNISRKLEMMHSDVNKMLYFATNGLMSEWKRELDMYKQQMESYKPQTALDLLEGIENAMNESGIEIPNITKAKLHYLKALCYTILLSKKAVGEYKKCYELAPTEILYKEKMVWIYYCRNQLEKAKELAQDIKDYDEDHQMANFILCYDESPKNFLENILRLPDYIQNSDKMQKCIFNVVINHYHDVAFRVIGKYLIERYRPQEVIPDGFSHIVDNLNRVDYLLFVYMNSIGRFEYYKKVEPTPVVEELYSLTKYICQTIDNTEIDSKFKIVKFWYRLLAYVVTNDKEALLNAEQYLMEKEQNGLLMFAQCLQYEGYDDNALKILDIVTTITEEHHYMKCFIYSKKGDVEHEIDSINDYIDSLITIDSLNFVRVVQVMTSRILLEGGNRIHVTSLIEKQFEKPIYLKIVKDIQECGDKRDEDSFAQLSKDVADEVVPVKSMVALISLKCGFYSTAVKLYQGIVMDGVYDKNSVYYIQALHNTKTNNEELIRLLSDWRKNSGQKNMALLDMEYKLRVTLRDWETALEIASSMYAENSFDEYTFTNYLICLWKNGKKDEIANIKDLASSIPFTNDEFIHNTALVFVQVGFVNDAVRFLYTYAKSVNKPRLRMDYINISSMMKKDTIFKTYEKVEDGMYVVYNTEKERKDKIVYIAPDSTSRFVDALREKHVGDTVLLRKTLVNAVVKIYIKNILNKYYALWKEIYEEMDTPETEMPAYVMNIPEDSNIELINDFVIKNFATAEMKRKQAIEDVLNKYERGIAPLGVAGMLLFEGDFIRAYYILCTDKYGILLNPYALDEVISTDESTEYVLDFSSMMLFFELYRNHGATFKHKFVISKIVRDIILDKKMEKQQEEDETMTLDISLEGVRPILHTKEEKDFVISMYDNMLTWIDENCKVEFSVSRLDELRSHDIGYNTEKHIGFDYTADYMHLVCKNNRIAISDDQLVQKMVMSKSQCICTYTYLHGTSCVNDVERKMLEMNYIGVPVNADFAYEEFVKKQKGSSDVYNQVLKGWSYLAPYNSNFITKEVTKLVKEIYLAPIVVNDIHSEVQNVFLAVLQGVNDINTFFTLQKCLNSEFKLLGQKLAMVMRDLLVALNKIGINRSDVVI